MSFLKEMTYLHENLPLFLYSNKYFLAYKMMNYVSIRIYWIFAKLQGRTFIQSPAFLLTDEAMLQRMFCCLKQLKTVIVAQFEGQGGK